MKNISKLIIAFLFVIILAAVLVNSTPDNSTSIRVGRNLIENSGSRDPQTFRVGRGIVSVNK